MKRILPAVARIGICALALGYAEFATAQEETTERPRDVELEEALLARRESLDFAQKAEILRQTHTAEQEAIVAIPEVQAIDAELESLRIRIRELLMLRQDVIERHAASLQVYRVDVEQAKEDLRAADPVRQVLDRRRAGYAGEVSP